MADQSEHSHELEEDLKEANGESPTVTLHGVVEKIISPPVPSRRQKVQIFLHGADDLFSQIRIENAFENGGGKKVKLQPGTEVDVTIMAREVVKKTSSDAPALG